MKDNWIRALIDEVTSQLRSDDYWSSRIRGDQKHNVHLGVFTEPLLQFVLEGKKTVESRFSINRCAPFLSVNSGDVVLIKASGGPVTAVAEVSNVWSYELNPAEITGIKVRFGPLLCVDEEFWDEKAECLYATLMRFTSVRKIQPVMCEKKDRRGWVVLQQSDQRRRSSQLALHY